MKEIPLNPSADSWQILGRFLGKDCTTISKEVKNHICFEKIGAYGRAFNDCRLALLHQCSAQKICSDCTSRQNRFCWTCGKCTSSCIIYEKYICPKLSKPPYEVFEFQYGKKILDVFHLSKIPADEIILSPELLK